MPGLRERVTSVTQMACPERGGNARGKADGTYADPSRRHRPALGNPWTLVRSTRRTPFRTTRHVHAARARPETRRLASLRGAVETDPGEGSTSGSVGATCRRPVRRTLGGGRSASSRPCRGRTNVERRPHPVQVALEGNRARSRSSSRALNAPAGTPASTAPMPTPARSGRTRPEGGSLIEVTIHRRRPGRPRELLGRPVPEHDAGSWRRTPRALRPGHRPRSRGSQTVYAAASARVPHAGRRRELGRLPWPAVAVSVPYRVSPSSPQTIYAVSRWADGQPGVRLWSSADAGMTWVQPVASRLPPQEPPRCS